MKKLREFKGIDEAVFNIIISTFIFLVSVLLFPSFLKASIFNERLQKELIDMCEIDQKARMDIISIKNPTLEQCKAINDIDNMHNLRLKEIINQYGWPGISLVGLEGESAMWLLVQHQDEDVDFQKECLDLLKKAVDDNEAPFRDYAYLVDRVKVHENLSQIYGTQWTQESGKYVLYPTEDLKNLNSLRAKAGLGSIEEYKEKIKEVYHLTEDDFK